MKNIKAVLELEVIKSGANQYKEKDWHPPFLIDAFLETEEVVNNQKRVLTQKLTNLKSMIDVKLGKQSLSVEIGVNRETKELTFKIIEGVKGAK